MQGMRQTDHMTLNFNNNMSMAAVFLDIKKAFDITWHSALLYKLSKSEFLTSLIKLISFFLSQCKLKIQCFGRRQNVYAKGNPSRGVSRFSPVPYFVQHVYK
jgi:hypothetical protein